MIAAGLSWGPRLYFPVSLGTSSGSVCRLQEYPAGFLLFLEPSTRNLGPRWKYASVWPSPDSLKMKAYVFWSGWGACLCASYSFVLALDAQPLGRERRPNVHGWGNRCVSEELPRANQLEVLKPRQAAGVSDSKA